MVSSARWLWGSSWAAGGSSPSSCVRRTPPTWQHISLCHAWTTLYGKVHTHTHTHICMTELTLTLTVCCVAVGGWSQGCKQIQIHYSDMNRWCTLNRHEQHLNFAVKFVSPRWHFVTNFTSRQSQTQIMTLYSGITVYNVPISVDKLYKNQCFLQYLGNPDVCCLRSANRKCQ